MILWPVAEFLVIAVVALVVAALSLVGGAVWLLCSALARIGRRIG